MPQGQTTPEKTLSNPWTGKGFCEPQQYRAAIDRCEGGYHSLDTGIDMFKQLHKILENHSSALRDWAKSSLKHIDDSKEFGNNKMAWRSTFRAVEKLAERNDKISAGVEKDVVGEMVHFKNEHYGKSFFHVRQIKKFEKEFKEAQKTWLQCLDKINEAKQAYHDAGHKLHIAKRNDHVIQTDVGSSDEERDKSTASIKRRTTETKSAETKYRTILKDSESVQVKYEKEMLDILKRTDEFEKRRLEHFKSIFTALKDATLIKHETFDTGMLQSFTEAIGQHDSDKDIAYFNTNYGSGKHTRWPDFEELKE
jgi:hypothetical protein